MKTNKKELTVFALCAYAIPFLMMPLLYICLQNGRDTSIFANAQMFYPAAGVMLAFLLARRQGTPKRFYILHIAATALMLAMSVLSAFLPQEGWLNIANFVIIIASVLGWIFLLTEKKTKREDYGLRLHGKFLTAFAICAYFLVVKTGMVFLSVALQGGDLLLLCSDGLTNAVPRAEMEQLLAAGPFYDLPDKLIHAANENGGPDNITALLVGIEPMEVRHG